jgi:hypothetical protein
MELTGINLLLVVHHAILNRLLVPAMASTEAANFDQSDWQNAVAPRARCWDTHLMCCHYAGSSNSPLLAATPSEA